MSLIHKEAMIAGKKLVIESGEYARQASSSVIVKLGETAVLTTVVLVKQKGLERGIGVLPLAVDYRERTYAMGKIPGGFFKREGRPKEREIHISRMIDRSVRPLFAKYMGFPVKVDSIVLSSDGENSPDVPAMIGASCALMISEVPYDIPIGCVRVVRKNGEFIINPTYEESSATSMEMILAGTEKEIVMIELQATQIDEKEIEDAVNHTRDAFKALISLQQEMKRECGQKKLTLEEEKNTYNRVMEAIRPAVESRFSQIIPVQDKRERQKMTDDLVSEVLKSEIILDKETKQPKFTDVEVKNAIDIIHCEKVREYIIGNKTRTDGRKFDEIRQITSSVGVLPRTHGAGMFLRGQTQALVTVTLGTPNDMQIMEELIGEYKERFLFHYNFPGFATGEIKPDRGPSRREIGHGLLAKRALYPLIPDENDFPYTIRVVSDILESNGSSSMASVCGASLALFDAGVPLKSSVAGVAMGLLQDGGSRIILTDISGLEDHVGETDFKVAGTRNGITAIQLDVKNLGMPMDLVLEILMKAKDARIRILDKMDAVISKPKSELSQYAPKLVIVQVPQDKIAEIIGPGGKNIRSIIEETKTEINIEEDGRVFISAVDSASVKMAQEIISRYTIQVEIGQIYEGKVVRITDFGAFVEILPGKDGLVHISQLANYHVNQVRDIVKEGEKLLVKVIDIDSQNRIALSHKAVQSDGKKQ